MFAKRMVNTLNMDRETWLDYKKKGISGSEVGALLGLNKWKSPISLYLEKLGELPEQEDNEFMLWGRILEPVIAEEFKRRNPNYKVKRVNAILQHPAYEWVLGNVDREIINEKGEKGILEIKTVSEYGKEAWEGEEIPYSYLVQLYWYLFVTGYDYGIFACLLGGNKYIQKYVKRDDEIINAMFEVAKDFWNRLQTKNPPEVDGSEASTEVLKYLYPKAESGSKIYLPSEYDNMLSEREELKTKIKELTEKKDAIENKIIAELKEAETAECEKFIVNYKNVNKTSLDTKSLKAKYPQYYTEFAKESSYRKFDCKLKGEVK